MGPGSSPTELFDGWFVKAVEKLKELPEGSGAFAALMIVLPLYERLIIAQLKLGGRSTDGNAVHRAIEKDLNLSEHQRRIFWNIFRDGFMHQAMGKSGKTQWLVSHKFGELPEFGTLRGQAYVGIDPWKFAKRVFRKFKRDPRLITASESFPLAHVRSIPNKEFDDA